MFEILSEEDWPQPSVHYNKKASKSDLYEVEVSEHTITIFNNRFAAGANFGLEIGRNK